MKLAALISGGKDSIYAAFLAKKYGNELSCIITFESKNLDSYMFHTPSISKVKAQAEVMGIPIIVQKTKGKKEEELKDIERAIKKAIKEYNINGITTGAVESVYQACRIQTICNELKIECFNPLWQKDQIELLNDLIKNKFEIIITSVAAYPLDESWIGRKIDKKTIEELKNLQNKYKINPAGEGGEYESFVLNCPLFKKRLNIKNIEVKKTGENSFRGEIELM